MQHSAMALIRQFYKSPGISTEKYNFAAGVGGKDLVQPVSVCTRQLFPVMGSCSKAPLQLYLGARECTYFTFFLLFCV